MFWNANNKTEWNIENQILVLPKNILRLRWNLVYFSTPNYACDKLILHMHPALFTVIDLYTNTVLFSGYLKARLWTTILTSPLLSVDDSSARHGEPVAVIIVHVLHLQLHSLRASGPRHRAAHSTLLAHCHHHWHSREHNTQCTLEHNCSRCTNVQPSRYDGLCRF